MVTSNMESQNTMDHLYAENPAKILKFSGVNGLIKFRELKKAQ